MNATPLFRRALAFVAVIALAAPHAAAQATKPFPDAWFFPDLPAGLKGLMGKPAPALKLSTWIGEKVDVPESRGKVVVLDFWATWCGPCMAAIPENVEMVEKYKDQGLVFLGVHDANSGWDSAQQVVNEKKINYSVAKDEEGGLSAKAVNLAFWPTYIVIDRAGIVRGVGLIPGNVEDAVKVLLAEAPPPGLEVAAVAGGGLEADYFFAGDKRPKALKAVEGKRMAVLEGAEWIGTPPTAAEMAGRVIVLHFLSSGNGVSMRQAEALAALENEIGPQGVLVVAICPPDDDWEGLKKLAAEGKLPVRVCRDAVKKAEAPAEGAKLAKGDIGEGPDAAGQVIGQKPNATRPIGATAAGFGVRYAPATVVIDRSGVVRGAGVKPDKVMQLAGVLLAEAVKPLVEEAEKAPSGG